MQYFTIGSLQNSFLKVAPFIMMFEKYRGPLFDYLLTEKIHHYDKKIRQLSMRLINRTILLIGGHSQIIAELIKSTLKEKD